MDNFELNILAGTKLEIHFKPSVTSMEKFFSQIEDNNMINVISIDLSHFDSSSLVNTANMFEDCKSLVSIDLSKFVTTNVENMNSMFSQCISLKELNLSSFDTSKVNYMDYMFYNCISLIILDISSFNLLQITGVEQLFTGVNNLDYINIYNTQERGIISSSSLNTDESVEQIFYVCQKTKIITNVKALNCCEFYNNESYCNFETAISTILKD